LILRVLASRDLNRCVMGCLLQADPSSFAAQYIQYIYAASNIAEVDGVGG
jgi:hypothetical protein